jgi:hypothetical protein
MTISGVYDVADHELLAIGVYEKGPRAELSRETRRRRRRLIEPLSSELATRMRLI